MEIEEPKGSSSSWFSTFFSKTSNIIITVVAGLGAAMVITGIVLAIVYAPSSEPAIPISPNSSPASSTTSRTTQSPSTTTKDLIFDKINSRVDCLPWLKNKTGVNVEAECAKNKGCKYESVDDNQIIPSCYWNTVVVQPDLISSEETRLGESYVFSIESGPNIDQFRLLRVDFEYLEDDVLRFKV